MDTTRQIIDYAQNEEGASVKDALYSAIHDKVMAHIEAKKQEMAQNFFNQAHDPLATVQDVAVGGANAE
jgi:hypothetical protein